MQAMLIEENAATRAGTAAALSRAGFAVTVAGSVDDAKAAVRRGPVDVLVTPERVGGRLAHDVALLAEWRNPGLGTILLSDRTAEEVDEIFDLLPSLRAVLERDAPARRLAQLALAAARWQEKPDAAPEAEVEDTTEDAWPAIGAAPAGMAQAPASAGSGRPLAEPAADPAPLAPVPEAPEVLDLRTAVPVTPQPAIASLLARVPSFLRFGRPRPEPTLERAALTPAPILAAPARRLHLA